MSARTIARRANQPVREQIGAMAGISNSDQKTMVRALKTMGMNLASRTPVGAARDVR